MEVKKKEKKKEKLFLFLMQRKQLVNRTKMFKYKKDLIGPQ